MIDTHKVRKAARMAPGLASTSDLMIVAADEVDRLRAVIANIIRATERDHYVSDTDAINNVVRVLRHHGFNEEVAPSAETTEG